MVDRVPGPKVPGWKNGWPFGPQEWRRVPTALGDGDPLLIFTFAFCMTLRRHTKSDSTDGEAGPRMKNVQYPS